MLNGLAKKNKLEQFKLEKDKRYKIIGDCINQDEGNMFDKLIEGFKVIGFRDPDIDEIFKIIAAIIHLGELQFM